MERYPAEGREADKSTGALSQHKECAECCVEVVVEADGVRNCIGVITYRSI